MARIASDLALAVHMYSREALPQLAEDVVYAVKTVVLPCHAEGVAALRRAGDAEKKVGELAKAVEKAEKKKSDDVGKLQEELDAAREACQREVVMAIPSFMQCYLTADLNLAAAMQEASSAARQMLAELSYRDADAPLPFEELWDPETTASGRPLPEAPPGHPKYKAKPWEECAAMDRPMGKKDADKFTKVYKRSVDDVVDAIQAAMAQVEKYVRLRTKIRVRLGTWTETFDDEECIAVARAAMLPLDDLEAAVGDTALALAKAVCDERVIGNSAQLHVGIRPVRERLAIGQALMVSMQEVVFTFAEELSKAFEACYAAAGLPEKLHPDLSKVRALARLGIDSNDRTSLALEVGGAPATADADDAPPPTPTRKESRDAE